MDKMENVTFSSSSVGEIKWRLGNGTLWGERILAFLFVLALHFSLFSLNSFAQSSRSEILKVYNWADYLDMDLIEEFKVWYKEQTGEKIDIVYQTFDINENMLTEIEVGHEDYDVVCPSEYIIERMLQRNLLQKIPVSHFAKTNTPNWLDNVSPWAERMFQEMAPKGTNGKSKQPNGETSEQPNGQTAKPLNVKDYTVGYMWGTTGFLYNRKYVKDEEVQSWSALLNPRFKNQIYVKDAFRDVYSVLINYARYDDIQKGRVARQYLAENLTDSNIYAVEDVLLRAKPQIAGWEADFGKERMCQGKVWLNLTWSGDALWAIDEEEEGVDLAYVVPKEGSNAWFDGWVIPIYAKNTKAAAYWIDFMCKEENAVRNMNETGYVSVIATPYVLENMIDDEEDFVDASYFFGPSAKHVRLNGGYYPDLSVISRCVLMHDTADRNEAMLEMWSRVKGNNLDWKMLTFVVSVILFGVLAYSYGRYKKIRRRHRRKMRLAKLRK